MEQRQNWMTGFAVEKRFRMREDDEPEVSPE